MLFPIKYGKILPFLQKKLNAETIYLILSISLSVSKLFHSFNTLGNYNWIFFFPILIQVYAIIYFKNFAKKMKKYYYLVYVLALFSYLSILYVNLDFNSNFLYGLEAMIVIYFNFGKIPNRIVRLIIFGLFALFFLKKIQNFAGTTFEILYFVFLAFILEVSLQSSITKKQKMRKVNKTDLNLKSPKKNNNFCSILTDSKKISLFKHASFCRTKTKQDKNRNFKKNISKNLFNFIKIGVLLINQDFDIIFSNNILLELFETEHLEEAKIKFFDLEENFEIAQNETGGIPDIIEFQDVLKNTLHFPNSFDSLKMEEISENKRSNRIISLSRFQVDPITSKDDLDSQFQKWGKKKITNTNNLENKKCELHKKSSKPQSIRKFLEKIFVYFKQGQESDKYIPRSDSLRLRKKDKKLFSMYVNHTSAKEGKDFFIFINFIPIEKNFDSNSQHEILITIRKPSDLEIKFIEEGKSKHKMLGSFCHELRTPINGIINMLDLMQSLNEESKQSKEKKEATFDELLSNATISSHLLLNEIDDFIDYFSHRNKILEPHCASFDFQSFFLEISRIFTYIARKKGLDLLLDLDSNIPLIICNDQQRLKQILFNLLSNIFFNNLLNK